MKIKKLGNKANIQDDYLHAYYELSEGDKVVASAAIYINEFHVYEGQPLASFGSFDCVEDYAVFSFLLDALVKEVQSLGYTTLLGPLDGSTWNTYRIVSSPQEDPFFLEVETPLYYKDFFHRYGFETFAEYISTKANSIEVNWEKNEARWKHFINMGVAFEAFNIDECELVFAELAILCNKSFRDNLLFSPITTERFVEKMMSLKAIINPRYTLLARYRKELVGFIFCYEDIKNKKEKTIVVKTLARDPRSVFQGLGSVLSSLAMKNVKEDGFQKGIHALMVDFNSSTYLSHKFKAELLRKYELLCYKIKD